MPRISIVTPTYNRAHLLGRVWDSLRNQSLADFEWVVVDDGSSDNTQTVVKAFADPRIRYHYQKNAGVNSARNAGERMAIGQGITFLDSDDELFDDQTLEFMETELLKAGPEVGCVGLPVQMTGHGASISIVPKPKVLMTYADMICERSVRGEFIYLFHRDAAALQPWPDLPGVEVFKYWGIAKQRPFLYINRPGRIYHTTSGENLTDPTSTIKHAPSMARGLAALVKEYRQPWLQYGPEIYGRYLCHLALNQALSNQVKATAKSLLEAWRYHGPKPRIFALALSLIAPNSLRQQMFLAGARLKRLKVAAPAPS